MVIGSNDECELTECRMNLVRFWPAGIAMRLFEVRTFLQSRLGDEDVSARFGVPKGTYTASQLAQLIAGHDDMESLELTNDGSKVLVHDKCETKFGVFRPN